MINLEDKYSRAKSELLFNKIKWQDYSRAVFDSALKSNKPIFLVVSAPSWCHWCHVYESEDFLFNESVYPLINDYFIPIFVDSDKRPDVLKQLEGGWPSTIFLAPDGTRLFGFSGPRVPLELRRLCEEALNIVKSKSFFPKKINTSNESIRGIELSEKKVEEIKNAFLSHSKLFFDKTFGGFIFGGGQKFPSGVVYDYLLDVYEKTSNKELLDMVKLTFDNQYTDINKIETNYHLFDPVEGGFHRYSTQSDWTAPHYEKMLYDNALLIQAYAHLAQLTKDAKVIKTVNLCVSFILNKLAANNGGFYNSQDANLEHFFYGKKDRSNLCAPFIDKTIKIENTALMASTFLYLYKVQNNLQYKEIALKNLDFIRDSLWGKNGALYYYDEIKKQSFLSGFSISNAYALLVFIEASELLNEKKYLSIADEIALFCINSLYDKTNFGFFERVSNETEFYPADKANDFSKNYRENALFSYCFIRLYLLTLKKEYLDVALKTLSIALALDATGLDETAYLMKTIELIEKNKLV